MLHSFREMQNCRIRRSGESLGSLRDLYLESREWSLPFFALKLELKGLEPTLRILPTRAVTLCEKTLGLELSPTPIHTLEEKPEELLSLNDICGQRAQARDGEFGRVQDVLFDATHWCVRFLVVESQRWWSRKRLLVPPTWVEAWDCSNTYGPVLRLAASRELLGRTPQFDWLHFEDEFRAALFQENGYEELEFWSDEPPSPPLHRP